MNRTDEVACLVEEVKSYAYANYHRGWDVLVECHTDSEIAEAIGKARTVIGAVRNVNRALGIMLYASVRADIRGA